MNNPAKHTKSCPACNRVMHKRAIMCHCGQTTWHILGGGFEGGFYKLVGELPVDEVMPLIPEECELGLCGKITIHRVPFNGDTVKIRIRNTFTVFKRQPACVGCGAAASKCLLVQRDNSENAGRSYNLVFVTADHIPLTIDHIVPRSKNGQHKLENLQTMCFICNNDKGKLSFEEYKKLYGDVRHVFDFHQQG